MKSIVFLIAGYFLSLAAYTYTLDHLYMLTGAPPPVPARNASVTTGTTPRPAAPAITAERPTPAATPGRLPPVQVDALPVRSKEQQRALDTLASLPKKDAQQMAAHAYLQFFYLNTKGRPEYCAKRTVDLAPFVSAFVSKQRMDFMAATWILQDRKLKAESVLNRMQPEMASMVEKDMQALSSRSKRTPEEICELLIARPEEAAASFDVLPEVKDVLKAGLIEQVKESSSKSRPAKRGP